MVSYSNSYCYGPDHWKSEKMATILFQFPMVLDKMAAILFNTEHCWKTKHHWKTERRATIGIPNPFGIPAPNVVVRILKSKDIQKMIFNSSIFNI